MSRPKNIGPSVEATADKLLSDLEAGAEMSCGCIPMPGLDVWLIASKDRERLQNLRQQLGNQMQVFFEANARDFGEVATLQGGQVLVTEGDGFKPTEGAAL